MKAQSSLEYLIIGTAVLAISAVTVLFLSGAFSGVSASVSSCKAAASQCAVKLATTASVVCLDCEQVCVDSSGKDVMSKNQGCGAACYLCKHGKTTRIGRNQPQELTPDSSTAGLWHFNEESGTWANDSSEKGNNGTISGATWNSSGRFGNALTFDGFNDFVNASNTTSLNILANMSVEAWIYPTSDCVTKDTCWIAGHRIGTNKWQFRVSFGKLYAGIHESDGGYAQTVTTESALSTNTWYHVAFVANGSAIIAYVNGIQYGITTSFDGTIQSSTQSTYIGTADGKDTRGFNGIIDEVAIYSRSKDRWEIWLDANA